MSEKEIKALIALYRRLDRKGQIFILKLSASLGQKQRQREEEYKGGAQ